MVQLQRGRGEVTAASAPTPEALAAVFEAATLVVEIFERVNGEPGNELRGDLRIALGALGLAVLYGAPADARPSVAAWERAGRRT